MKISKQELEAVTALSHRRRYGYFIKRICDWEQVWVLFEDDCIVLNEAKNGKLLMCFCSHLKTLLRTMRQTQKVCKQPHIGVLIYTNSLKQS